MSSKFVGDTTRASGSALLIACSPFLLSVDASASSATSPDTDAVRDDAILIGVGASLMPAFITLWLSDTRKGKLRIATHVRIHRLVMAQQKRQSGSSA